jgi:hypothetical protein
MPELFDAHPAEQWTPVRYIRNARRCDFCGIEIPAGSPGATRGTRGTKAYFNPHRNVWECMPCRSEATRADFIRLG